MAWCETRLAPSATKSCLVPLTRGAVWRTLVLVTDAATGELERRDKYVVVLQDPDEMDLNATNLAVVLGSRDRSHGRGPREFEVLVRTTDGGFPQDTMLDGRWVYTYPRSLIEAGEYVFTLGAKKFADLTVAVFLGLQLGSTEGPDR